MPRRVRLAHLELAHADPGDLPPRRRHVARIVDDQGAWPVGGAERARPTDDEHPSVEPLRAV
ncbi:hypothetical protein GCM10027055_26580 [Janibacter alkaliphilus]